MRYRVVPGAGSATPYQTPQSKRPDRKDHVWVAVHDAGTREHLGWRCVLCGAFTRGAAPPDYPTPWGWLPERYDALSEADREKVRAQ